MSILEFNKSASRIIQLQSELRPVAVLKLHLTRLHLGARLTDGHQGVVDVPVLPVPPRSPRSASWWYTTCQAPGLKNPVSTSTTGLQHSIAWALLRMTIQSSKALSTCICYALANDRDLPHTLHRRRGMMVREAGNAPVGISLPVR
jgi:hypothetical protein